MKVLFAVSNASLSEDIAKQYLEMYGETLEYKDVFYFKAVLEEVKRDKTYDRIVIAETLEPVRTNIVAEIDKMLFNNIDAITDEAENSSIIFICAENRTRKDDLLGRFYNIGLYNILLGDERQTAKLCRLIKTPRGKKEAKEYLKGNEGVSDIVYEQEQGVKEDEILSICRYFDNLRSPEDYVKAFEEVTNQYDSEEELITIVAALTTKLRRGNEIFDSLNAEPKFQKYCAWRNMLPQEQAVNDNKKGRLFHNIIGGLKNVKNNAEKRYEIPKKKNEAISIKDDGIGATATNTVSTMTSPFGSQPTQEVKTDLNKELEQRKQEELERKQQLIREKEEELKRKQEELFNRQQEERLRQQEEELKRKQQEALKQQEELLKKQQEELLKKQQEELARKQQEEKAKAEQEALLRKQQEEATAKMDPLERAKREAILRAQQKMQPNMPQEDTASKEQEELLKKQQEELMKAQQEEQQKALLEQQEEIAKKQQEELLAKQQEELLAKQQEELRKQQEAVAALQAEEEELKRQQEELRKQQEELFNSSSTDTTSTLETSSSSGGLAGFNTVFEENSSSVFGMQDNEAKFYTGKVDTVPENYNKVVAVVGTNRVGTSFIVNTVATLLSLKGIKVSILDVSKNKGLFWYYIEDIDRKIDTVATCMSNLCNGVSRPVLVGKAKVNLYTTIPQGKEDNRMGYKHKTMVDAARRNCNLVIIDCDFTTPMEYIEAADEVYVVQDLDLVKCRETIEYFKFMQDRRIGWDKIRLVMNNVVGNCKITSRIVRKEVLTRYDDENAPNGQGKFPEIRKFVDIPMDPYDYRTYLNGMTKGKLEFDEFTLPMKEAIDTLSQMVYGIPSRRRGLFGG